MGIWYDTTIIVGKIVFKFVHTYNMFVGPFACELYGMIGSLFGVTSIWTMVFIALDRYNVIVKVKKKYKSL